MTAEEKLAKLADALKWFIENDETNRGEDWEQINEYWIRGLERGIDALSLVDPEGAERLREASFNRTTTYL